MIDRRQAVSVNSQPRGIAVATPGLVFTALSDSIVIHENGSSKSAFPTTNFSPTSIAATSNGLIVIGGDVSFFFESHLHIDISPDYIIR